MAMLYNLSSRHGEKNETTRYSFDILLSASITAGKLALSFIPNIEIVTLLFIVYTVSFGLKRSLLASVVLLLWKY